MLVQYFLEQSADLHPEKTALVTSAGRFTYRQVNRMADGVAQALRGAGLSRGDRAVVFLDNSLEAVVSIFGILKAGGVFVMANHTMKAEKLGYMVRNCRAVALFAPFRKSRLVEDVCREASSLQTVLLAGTGAHSNGLPVRPIPLGPVLEAGGEPLGYSCPDVDLATIIYTSGSTGRPKGVMMTHLNVVAAATSITTYLENVQDDIILNTLPLSFDYGLYQVLMGFKVGGTVILEKSFLYPYQVIQTLNDERVTGFPLVPTMAAILLGMADIKQTPFPHLRYISNTAAALPVSHIRKLQEFFPDTRIYSMYGLTECKRVSYLPPEELTRRPSSVGRGMPNTEVYVVDDFGSRVGPNIVGELVVRGSHVMRGYWELPEETAERLRPGPLPGEMLLHTGDLFRMDEEGFLYFVARKDDIIKSRGEKVSPKEVENVLCALDGVAEAAVVGVADPVLGQAVKAYIVARPGASLTERNVQRFCAQHLEDFMIPKQVDFRDELPKTSTGKISKLTLR